MHEAQCRHFERFFQKLKHIRREQTGTSLVVQWLRLHAPNAGALGSIPDQGTSAMGLKLRPDIVK